ncbi:DUF445 domain-containing protein [Rhizobacter sp. LjRoot28]|uniref:DUF445 domain-containing protein n=1 Tax=Rhizobacter sp. LjRoot28 TaxID=3342309 RepID=UPI003ECCC88B
MKWIALALLAGAAVVYALASVMQARHPAWGYVAAFSEAAMVGALADWFAVVALFRHPLGLPIPHTAIIPSNKDRIGENLATFICANFLGTEQVLQKLKAFKAGDRLAAWLADPAHAAQVASHLGAVLAHALRALDDEPVRHFFRSTVLARLDRVDSTRLVGELLDVLTADGRHQRVLDASLRQLGDILNDDTLKAEVAEVVAAEVKYLRFVGLDNAAGRYATEKMVAGVVRLIGEMGEDPQHPLRQRFDAFMATFIADLKHDPAMQARGERLKQELLGHPQLAEYLHGLWSQVIAWTRDDLAREDSTVRGRMAEAARGLGDQLLRDAGMREWIDARLLATAPRWIERYREDIRRYIVARVADWNADEMTGELERNIGRDLQFIRINGTLVGGLAGLLIHTLTELARA